MKIHLIEDNADMLEALRMLLDLRGYRVRTYLRALDLLDALAGVGPDDIIVSDYYLPDLNGVQLLKQVRVRHPGVRAVLLTGSRENDIASLAHGVPECTVLYKPVDFDALERGLFAFDTPPGPAEGARA